MTAALLLLAYAAPAATLGRSLLLRMPWVQRAPRWGVLAWQALSWSVLMASVLACLALALCMLPLRFGVAQLVGMSPPEVSRHYEPPTGDWLGLVGLAAMALTLLYLSTRTALNLRRARAARRDQMQALGLLGRTHALGFTVIQLATPLIYCIPGRRRVIVVSSGALALLGPEEMRLVLAHERSHLRARHDLALAFSGALHASFPRVELFADLHRETAILLEMLADDAARGQDERRTLASALVTLAAGVRPEASLAAGDTAALMRVRRLVSGVHPVLPLRQRLTAGMAIVGLLAIPVGLALAPAIGAASRNCCIVVSAEASH